MKKTMLAAALMAAGLLASASASAQFYVGVSIGEAEWNIDCTGFTSCSKNGTAYKGTVGYNITPQWGVEGTYFDLGKPSWSVYPVNGDFQATGFDLAGVYNARISKDWTLFTKLGVAQIKGKIDGSLYGYSASTSYNSTQPMVGFGAIYNVTPNFGLRFDIDTRKVSLASGSGGSGTVTNVSVGAQGSF
ncbi:MAG: outer membrane beta-barrel protein [Burkholderiaceae bacterium]|nr:outer membrane beta-barrel protein [Burkholderiaceae bacterium]